MPSLKPDCAHAVQRKAGTSTPLHPEQSVLYSPGCRANIANNGHVSRISWERATKFLCSLDCVAEREGFEPPVQVWRKRRRSRVSYRDSGCRPRNGFGASDQGFGCSSAARVRAARLRSGGELGVQVIRPLPLRLSKRLAVGLPANQTIRVQKNLSLRTSHCKTQPEQGFARIS